MKIPINITFNAQSEIDTEALAQELTKAMLLRHAGERTDSVNTDTPMRRWRCPTCRKITRGGSASGYHCVPCDARCEVVPGRIFGFGCEAGVGKDTAGAYLVERCGFNRIGFADALKEGARAVFGFTDDQLFGSKKSEIDPYWKLTPRDVLQRMGTEAMRATFGDDLWVRAVERVVLDGRDFVITDVRFPNEAEAVKRWGGKVVRLIRDDKSGARGGNTAHRSEVSLLGWDGWDWTIYNNGTVEELHENIARLVALLP